VAKDIQNGNEFALKRLFGSDKDECNNILNEVNIHKQVSGHENIVKFIAASFIDRTKNNGRAEYLLVMELCKSGSLYDYLEQINDAPSVLRIIYQATRAIAHLHSLNINHRDIKIENFLLGADGMLKLCDFGSSTTDHHAPDITWSTQQRNAMEEFLQRFTTPMYRAPEQLDTWSNFPIGIATDVWALGCILYCLCYKRHPFEDGAKLRIINGNYSIPSDSRFANFNEIIKGCFVVDPAKRLTITKVLEQLAAVSETMGFSLKGRLEFKLKTLDTETTVSNQIDSEKHLRSSQLPTVAENSQQTSNSTFFVPPPPTNQQISTSGGLFSSIKGYHHY
jgi:cyclin G-associated kinase